MSADIDPNIQVSTESPEDVLKKLRGDEWMCGCGRILRPALNEQGVRIGVEHLTLEDDDWHCAYFAGIFVRIP